MRLTSAQEREIVAIEKGVNTPILEIPTRRFGIWSNMVTKGLLRINREGLPELTGLGQAEYHRIYMRNHAPQDELLPFAHPVHDEAWSDSLEQAANSARDEN